MSDPKVPNQATRGEMWEIDHRDWGAQLQETWYVDQVEEPENHVGKSILVRWLDPLDSKEENGWRCCVPLEGETWCTEKIDRIDRAIVHVRVHLDHKPYSCEGRCNKENCNMRFTSKEYRAAHVKGSDWRSCEWCGKKELRQNLARHKKQCSVKPSEQAAEGSSTGA